MSKYTIFYLEVVSLLVLPVILSAWYPQVFAARYTLTVIGAIYCAWRLIHSSATLTDLGIHRSGFKKSLKELLLPSLFLIIVTFLIFYLLPLPLLTAIVGSDPLPVTSILQRAMVYFFISTPLQELIFRGYLTWRLNEVFDSARVVKFISVGLFTFAHLPFMSPLILVITLIMGTIYIKTYLKYTNIFALILSHSVVGTCLIIIRNAWFPF